MTFTDEQKQALVRGAAALRDFWNAPPRHASAQSQALFDVLGEIHEAWFPKEQPPAVVEATPEGASGAPEGVSSVSGASGPTLTSGASGPSI